MKTNIQKVFNLFYPKLILVFSIVLLLGVYIKTFAIGSPYNPGDTLDPACAPGEVNCYVSVGSALTFSTGLTNTANTITNNLSTGVIGGQSIIGGTASGNDLTLSSTSHVTKGKIIFGTSAYDEANNRLGIGTTTPDEKLVVMGDQVNSHDTYLKFNSGRLTLGAAFGTVASNAPSIDFYDTESNQIASRIGYGGPNTGISITNYFSGLTTPSVYFDHGLDANALVVTYGVAAYGIASRVGIGTSTPSSRLDVVSNNLGTTQTTASGIALSNTHTALNGLQQMSPALRWSGHGWKTDAVAGSQDVEFRAYVTPVQGSANPTGYLGFGSSINGGAYNDNQLVLTSDGYVGIGTTTPEVPLSVVGPVLFTTSNAPNNAFVIYNTDISNNLLKINPADQLFLIDESSSGMNVGIGTASPSATLHVEGTQYVSGAVQFNNYGAGTALFDAAGNITSSSDERLKDIQGNYTPGLTELMNLNPILYKWNALSKLETEHTYAGFSAQNVQANIPYGTGVNKDGYLSLQDRAILATTVNAIKEMNIKVTGLLSLDLSNANSLGSLVKNFLSDAGNQIENLYSKVIHSNRVETKTLCVGSTCVSEEQFLKMLQQSENSDEDGGPVDQTPIDVCLNIDGDQSVIPVGYHLDVEQNCVEDLTPDPLPPADPEFPPAQDPDSTSVNNDEASEKGNLNQEPTPISEASQSE
jgi:hypothetical protein